MGAFDIEIYIDPNQGEIVGVVSKSTHFSRGFTANNLGGGKIRIIGSNSGSLVDPIGGVNLAVLKVKPKIPSGLIRVSSFVKGIIDAREGRFASAVGYGAEIIVTPRPKTGQSQDVSLGNVEERARRLRPEGVVSLWDGARQIDVALKSSKPAE